MKIVFFERLIHKMFGLRFLLRSKKPDVEFITPFSIDECKSRLTKELNLKPAILGLDSSNPVIERISDDHFLISRKQSFPFRDNYHPLLEGRLTTKNDGTLISASFWVNNGSIFAVLIFGFILFFGMAIYQVVFNSAELGLLFIPIVFFGLFGLVVLFMSRSNKSKRKLLANYLQRILTPDADSENNAKVPK